MSREISSFPLITRHKARLREAGFLVVDDLNGLKPAELSKELSITKEEALVILKKNKSETAANIDRHTAQSTLDDSTASTSHFLSVNQSLSAFDLLQDNSRNEYITTFSEAVDNLLAAGGVPVGKITEFCGAPGVGKTQLCLQLCVDVEIPVSFGGLGGESLFMDTEGSFTVNRLEDMAAAAIKHCTDISSSNDNADQRESLSTFTVDSILAGIHYIRCHDYVQLLAAIRLLPDFIKIHPKVKLIVIDSIAFHFRHDFEDFSLRTRILNGLAQNLMRFASKHLIAVVLTNQMTTKFNHLGSSKLIPALGESWGHASTIRVILYWDKNQRYALLYKSPTHQENVVPFQVTMGGIRDVRVPKHFIQDNKKLKSEYIFGCT